MDGDDDKKKDENGDLEEKEKMAPGMDAGGMPPAAPPMEGGGDMAKVISLLEELLALSRGTEDMTKEKEEAGVAEVESPNEKDTATPDSGKTGGTPQDQVATTLSQETELNKSMLYSMAKENVLKEQKIEALEKQLASVDKGNPAATRDGNAPPTAPPVDKGVGDLPGGDSVEDKQKAAIKLALHGDGTFRDFSVAPTGGN